MLALFPVDAGGQGQCVIAGELIRGHQPGSDTAGADEILALGDVELGVAYPVPQGALVHQCEPGDMPQRLLLLDTMPRLADDQHYLTLVIQLL